MKKNLAILIPCYKAAPTIVETLEAFQKQSKEALSRVACVVIADDCTPDNTLDLVRQSWQLTEPPLKFEQREKNLGEMMNVTTAVFGLDSSIEWYFNMHGDNVPTPDFLETFIKHIDKADDRTGIIAGSYHSYDGHQIFETGDNTYDKTGSIMIEGNHQSIKNTMFMGCWWHNSCCAFRVKTFRELGGLPKGMVQKGDYDLLLRVLAEGWNIEYLPKSLMLYRQHEGSVSSKNFLNHTDIIETLNIDQNYSHVLSFQDKYVIYIHQVVFKTLLRRMVRSILSGNFQRFVSAAKVTQKAVATFIKSL